MTPNSMLCQVPVQMPAVTAAAERTVKKASNALSAVRLMSVWFRFGVMTRSETVA